MECDGSPGAPHHPRRPARCAGGADPGCCGGGVWGCGVVVWGVRCAGESVGAVPDRGGGGSGVVGGCGGASFGGDAGGDVRGGEGGWGVCPDRSGSACRAGGVCGGDGGSGVGADHIWGWCGGACGCAGGGTRHPGCVGVFGRCGGGWGAVVAVASCSSGVCDLHVGVDGSAEGGGGSARGCGESAVVDAGAVPADVGGRDPAEDAGDVRCVGVGVVLAVDRRGAVGDRGAGRAPRPGLSCERDGRE